MLLSNSNLSPLLNNRLLPSLFYWLFFSAITCKLAKGLVPSFTPFNSTVARLCWLLILEIASFLHFHGTTLSLSFYLSHHSYQAPSPLLPQYTHTNHSQNVGVPQGSFFFSLLFKSTTPSTDDLIIPSNFTFMLISLKSISHLPTSLLRLDSCLQMHDIHFKSDVLQSP